MYKNILIPIDGSKEGPQAIAAAKEIGMAFGAKLFVLTVIPEVSIFEQYPSNFPFSLEISKANTERAEFVLSDVEKLLADYPHDVETSYTSGSPSHEIEAFAEEHGIDLIVMGNRGLGAFSRTVLGSTSTKVINQSKCSVLVVKTHKE